MYILKRIKIKISLHTAVFFKKKTFKNIIVVRESIMFLQCFANEAFQKL